jgi:hypothetical protein
MKVSDAIDYIVNDSKTIFDKQIRPETPRDFPPGVSMGESNTPLIQARRQLGDKISIGTIRSWGRQIDTKMAIEFESPLREIPSAYWEDMKIDFHAAKYYVAGQQWSSQTLSIPGRAAAAHKWTDIKVSRTQIESLWPKKSIIERLYNRLRKQLTSYKSPAFSASFSTCKNSLPSGGR